MLAAVLLGCARSPVTPVAAQARRHVLFIGNSLTYSNDLPATFAAIAALAGDTIEVASVAGPNLALIDHINGSSNALAVIRSRKWDVVVLQQGPTTTSLCRDSLVLWTRMFDPHIRQAQAIPALFMTWPPRSSMERMDAARISFQVAAQAVNGIFLPAGEAWRLALAQDSTLPLYSGDGFHPSELGSYLAALVIYARLAALDPRTLPPLALAGQQRLPVSENAVRLLQGAAHAAIARYPAATAVVPAATPQMRARTQGTC